MSTLNRKLVAMLMILFVFGLGFIINATEICAKALIEKNDKPMDYFPRSVGNTWTYVASDDEGKSHRSTSTITAEERISGEQCFVIENKINGVMYERIWFGDETSSIKGYKREQPISPDENVIEQYYFDPPILGFVTLPSAMGNRKITVSEVEFFAIKEGEIIEHGWRLITFISTAVGKESVVTPAGTFNDCIKFERRIRPSGGDEIVQYIWLAPEVGQVKFTMGDIEFQLCDYGLHQND